MSHPVLRHIVVRTLWSLALALGVMAVLAALLYAGAAHAAEPGAAEPAKSALELVLQYVVAPLLAILAPLLVAALGKLVTYLHARERESMVARVGAVAAEAAHSVVAELDVTLRPKLEAALADGVLTDAEKAELKTAALTALKTRLPPALLGNARSIYGPLLETWLGGLVERAVTARAGAEAVASPPSP